MADVVREKLMLRYRHLFSRGGFPTVGEGWNELLELVLGRIDAVMAGERKGAVFRIKQIKEKFGTIRIYYEAQFLSASAKSSIEEAVALAEARSGCTCEICGSEARLYNRTGWYTTRCPPHADGDPVRVAPGWENLRIVRKFLAGGIRIVSCRRYDRERDEFVDAALPDDWNEE